MKEALFYQFEGENIRCRLCPHNCLLREGQRGICRVREHGEGKLVTHNYGYCTSAAMDPIEKKPLFHFHPGKYILSVGTKGCNFKCKHCQNWSIAHEDPQLHTLSSEALVELAMDKIKGTENLGIAYTYSEPSVWYEFILDSAVLAHSKGLKNVVVTNGFIEEAPLRELLPYIDAMNIDIKAFTEEFYRKICGGSLEGVLRTAKIASKYCHIEITTLVIPGLNDSEEEIKGLCRWIKEEVGIGTPLHLSRYFPNYQLECPPTPVDSLERLRQIALDQLKYVYIGNVGGEGGYTYCPQCKMTVIQRSHFGVDLVGVDENHNCKYCGERIYYIN